MHPTSTALRVLLTIAIVLVGFELGADPPNADELTIKELQLKATLIQNTNRSRSREKEKSLELTSRELKRLTDHYRKKYPYRSLRQRLAHEKRLPNNRPLPILTKETAKRLDDTDNPKGTWKSRSAYGATLRSQSLAMLHSDNVRRFITQEGFGIQRFGPPAPSMLELPEAKSVPLDTPPVASAKHFDDPEIELPTREADYYKLIGKNWIDIPEKEREVIAMREYGKWMRRNNPLVLPSPTRLYDVHEESVRNFASRWTNGHVRDIDNVAGFEPHAVSQVPRVDTYAPWQGVSFLFNGDEMKARATKRVWSVTRMQLVSLLKHDKPGVYLSDNLPRMEQLADARTRPLDGFEEGALEKLRRGEDIVTTARTNRIHMLGAVRAAKRCLECHDVHRGELLGAFSYELTRKKPILPIREDSRGPG